MITLKRFYKTCRIKIVLLIVFKSTSLNAFDFVPYSDFFDENAPSDKLLKIFSPSEAGTLYEILGTIDEVFLEHNVCYWIDGGTLLGAARHGGIIPWDSDGDIEVFESDYEKIMNLKDVLNEKGFEIIEWTWGGFVVRKMNCLLPKVDIFLTKIDESNNRYILSREGCFFNYHQNYFLESEIENLIRIPFGPLYLNAPNNYMRYLYSYYGPDVMTHAPFRLSDSKSVTKLKIINFDPAKYTQ